MDPPDKTIRCVSIACIVKQLQSTSNWYICQKKINSVLQLIPVTVQFIVYKLIQTVRFAAFSTKSFKWWNSDVLVSMIGLEEYQDICDIWSTAGRQRKGRQMPEMVWQEMKRLKHNIRTDAINFEKWTGHGVKPKILQMFKKTRKKKSLKFEGAKKLLWLTENGKIADFDFLWC